MSELEELSYFKNRVLELEKQVSHLRISRRVLMTLIERIESEKKDLLNQQEEQTRKLRLDNLRYAKSLMQNNCRYVELITNLKEGNVLTGED